MNFDESNSYVQKIKQIPYLQSSDEYQLARQWKENNDHAAMEKIIKSHLRLVAKIATGYRGYGLSIVDLIAEGNMGMMHAMKHYDPERGFRFATYATWWIKAKIHDYIIASWSLVKLGTTNAQKKLFFGLRKQQRQLDSTENATLSDDDAKTIADNLNVSQMEVIEMHKRLKAKDNSLNVPLYDDGNKNELIEWISDDRDNQEIQLANHDEITNRRKILSIAIQSLSKREKNILIARHMHEPPKTFEQIGQENSLSRERVRQIDSAVFAKLKQEIKKLQVNFLL